MFRNQYDTDPTTFSPQGRLFQVEYAAEAVKQGSCCVGIKSKTHAVLGVLKRSPDELASYQEKLFKMDSHLVISISGLTADARYLSDHMRMECLNHRFVYGASLQVGRLVSHISDMHQRCTQDMTYERGRPFGVGLLVAGYDKTGPHIYETSPTAHYYEHKAQAIGSRSQSARTYLEKVFETFPDLSVDELVIHALKSLEGAAGDKDLTAESVGIAIVGKDQDVKMLSADELKNYLNTAFGDATVSTDDVEMKEA
jgi:20S proteasome subunit alpha 6